MTLSHWPPRRTSYPTNHIAAAIISILGFEVGTGGLPTIDYLRQRGDRGYARISFNASPNIAVPRKPLQGSTSAQQLDQIKSVFRAATTDLAKVFGVSRQSIYHWLAGEPVAAANAERIADLANATSLLMELGLTDNPRQLRRVISDGKNLFDIVRDGGSATTAAKQLAAIIDREHAQQQKVNARLANRQGASKEAWMDIGSPMFKDNG